MKKIEYIKSLVRQLTAACEAYYKNDNPIMTDKQFDDLFDELEKLENETGFVMCGSPTQKVQGYVINELKKVKHTKPMLSANKTKEISEIERFIGNQLCILSWKLDGLTIVLRYKDNKFTQAITRGNGEIGEDVTHTMSMCSNIPMTIPYTGDLEVRGECVISWEEFNKINETLNDQYKHPRNLAAGTVRQLDSNISRSRKLTFKAFELVQDELYERSKTNLLLRDQLMDIKESFDYLEECGFEVVEHELVTNNNISDVIERFDPEKYQYPVDGLVVMYNSYEYGKQQGKTSHHPLNMLALKWEDQLYETTLEDVLWNTSKTGLINPVAIFSPVDLDGAITTRATLHNVSYIEDLELGIGDSIQIYRSNMVIPKVHESLTRSNNLDIPSKCPCCGGDVEIHNENGSKTLHCMNQQCSAKLLSQFVYFVSRECMNIDGLSEATLDRFIQAGWLIQLKDIYHLYEHKKEMIHMDGFGKRRVEKLLDAIEKSRNSKLSNFITALSIPLIGKSTAKDMAKVCHNHINEFFLNIESKFDWSNVDGIGDTTNDSINDYFDKNLEAVKDLIKEINFSSSENDNHSSKDLSGLTFVITGKVEKYKNRNVMKEEIESKGGKVSGSVSSKTNYLVNNDMSSNSSKNKKAKELMIPIITEDELIKLIR